jgi:predicted lipoprotein with Yx(FWY)xxD motif
MQMSQGRSSWSKFALGATALLAATALTAAACSSSTSDKDKTATAVAKGGTTAVATSGATKAAATSAATTAATAAATKAATTPAAGATTAATAGAAGGSLKVADSKLGKVLVDDKGLTLYTFKNDTSPGKSACNGGCATAWPPATAAAAPKVDGATGEFTLITRDDGTKQVAYKGAPLYRFANDKAAGDTNGDGVGGVWSAAKP